jgi:AraC-like DNA-binding protein
LFNNLSDSSAVNLDWQSFQTFLAVCQHIKDELALPADASTLGLLKNHVQNLMLLAEREKRKQGFAASEKGPDFDYTLLFMDLLEKNYNRLKTVGDYTPQLHISEKRLGQATKKVLGKPPKEIINDRVLLEAKRLLVYTNLSIKETGQSLGFEDPAYFVRYFKKKTGTTPIEFREQ